MKLEELTARIRDEVKAAGWQGVILPSDLIVAILAHLESKAGLVEAANAIEECHERGGTSGDFRRARWEVREALAHERQLEGGE